jgi:argininosuccinate lyase
MESVQFDFEHMQKAAETGYMNAFAAATYLVQKGVPFRMAHEHTGKAVRLALDHKCELQDLSLAQLQAIAPQFADDFYDFVKLGNVLAIHDVPGGTAPARVHQAIAAARQKAGAVQQEAHAHA